MRNLLYFILFLFTASTTVADNIFFGDKLIKVDLSEFNATKKSNETDRFYLSAVSLKGKTSFSIAVSPDAYADSLTCRQALWSRTAKKEEFKENIREYEREPYAIVEWTGKPVDGIAPRHLNAYWARDGISAAIHIYSADGATSAELQKILERIRIGNIPLVYQLCIKGKAAFDRGEYTTARQFLRPAMTANANAPELNMKEQRDLALWSGISEAMCGNLQEAENIFTDAIKNDPKYALFHYNLACVKAEQGNLPQALLHLENALQNRANISQGQEFPDPQEDTSFKPYKEDKAFNELLKKYNTRPATPEKDEPPATKPPLGKPMPLQIDEKIPKRQFAPLI